MQQNTFQECGCSVSGNLAGKHLEAILPAHWWFTRIETGQLLEASEGTVTASIQRWGTGPKVPEQGSTTKMGRWEEVLCVKDLTP